MVGLSNRHGVALKRTGKTFSGKCPFHADKSPSFHVYPDEKRFYCFGCQARGDVFTFVKLILGTTFPDAVRELAQQVGVDLATEDDAETLERTAIKTATDFAQSYFTRKLWEPGIGEAARTYLRKRGIPDDLSRDLGLGWAPLTWSGLVDALGPQGLLAAGEKAGVVVARSSGQGYYDAFRGRIIIPIRSPEGRTIAFGGRLVEGDDGAKYINSKESRLYAKSSVLYGIDRAKDAIRKCKSAVLCEGYFDCIALHQANVSEAVALCSTALTPGHIDLLVRLGARNGVTLLLDGDDAGRGAIERLAPVIFSRGLAAKVALLPSGEDPDTFARSAGAQGVRLLLSSALPLSRHLMEAALPRGVASSYEEKLVGFERLARVVAGIPVGIERTSLIQAIAAHFGWERTQVDSKLAVKKGIVAKEPVAPRKSSAVSDVLEVSYSAFVIKDPSLLTLDQWRACDDLRNLELRTLTSNIMARVPVSDALFEASPDVKDELALAAEKLPASRSDVEAAFVTTCANLKRRTIEERLSALAKELSNAAGSRSDLTQELRELLDERGLLLKARATMREVLHQVATRSSKG